MGLLNINAYPCAWPFGWYATPEHKRRASSYRVDFKTARDHVVAQAKRMGAREIVVSTNIPLRRDGLPYAGQPEPADPAVAVYWVVNGKPQAIACDQWRKARENMRAVGMALAAMHQLKLSGATQVFEKAFVGLTALAADNPKRTWREVFGYDGAALLTEYEIVLRFKELAALRHPDKGGSTEAMVELNVAFQEALAELRLPEERSHY